MAVRLVGGPGGAQAHGSSGPGHVGHCVWRPLGLAEAAVVCRQLGGQPGCGGPHEEPTLGQVLGKIALDNMQCVGSESHLGQCVHGARLGTTAALEDASVVCTGERLLSVPAWRGCSCGLPTQPTHTHTHPSGTHTPPSLRMSVDQAGSLAPSQVVQPQPPPSCSD